MDLQVRFPADALFLFAFLLVMMGDFRSTDMDRMIFGPVLLSCAVEN